MAKGGKHGKHRQASTHAAIGKYKNQVSRTAANKARRALRNQRASLKLRPNGRRARRVGLAMKVVRPDADPIE